MICRTFADIAARRRPLCAPLGAVLSAARLDIWSKRELRSLGISSTDLGVETGAPWLPQPSQYAPTTTLHGELIDRVELEFAELSVAEIEALWRTERSESSSNSPRCSARRINYA
jgi:hypothetical protein